MNDKGLCTLENERTLVVEALEHRDDVLELGRLGHPTFLVQPFSTATLRNVITKTKQLGYIIRSVRSFYMTIFC